MSQRLPHFGRRVEFRLAGALTALGLVIIGGALGYRFIEDGWSMGDALYMAVIVVTTVGLQEVHELSGAGRLFTIVLVLGGVGVFSYSLTTLASHLITGELRDVLGYRRMERRINELSGHQIVCGFGRMGRQVAHELKRQNQPLVVIDQTIESIERAFEEGYLALVGDARDDDVLRRAGVERAKGLVTSLDDDADNLMVVLSARALNEKLFIVSRLNKDVSESKLITAGAHRVISPYGIGGRRMAQLAVRPNVVEFLEIMMHDEDLELWLEDVTVASESKLDGVTVGDSHIHEHCGANVLAIRQRTGTMMVAPKPETVFQAGDILVALGTREQLTKLAELGN